MSNRTMIFMIGLILLIPIGIINGWDANNEQTLATTIDVTLGTAPTVDGVIGATEWTDASSVIIAQTSGGPWTVYYKHTLTDVYFAFTYGNGFITDLCLDVNNDDGSAPQTDDYKLHSSAANYENIGTGSAWNRQSISGWSAESRGMVNAKEYRISYTKLGITAGVDKTIGIMFHILANPGASDGDWPSGANTDDPSTWGTMSSSDSWGDGIVPNDPPLLENGGVDPGSGFTDEEYTFSVDYSDANDDEPTISRVFIDGTPHEMTSSETTYIDGVTFTYTGYLDDSSHSFYFLFNDGEAEARFPETGVIEGPEVIAPNTPPEMAPGGIPNGTYSIEEDSGMGDNLIDLEEYFSDDRDDGELRFEIIYQEAPSKLLATIDGKYLDLSQMWENWYGSLEFQVKALDFGLDGAISGDDLFTESNPFTIEVTPVNDDPVITRIGPFETLDLQEVSFLEDQGAVEDEWFNFSVQISEIDQEEWDVVALPQGASHNIPFVIDKVSNSTLDLSWMPTITDVGMKHFNLTIKDQYDARDSILITVEVLSSNDAPYIDFFVQGGTALEPENGSIELSGDLGAFENEWYNFTISAQDEEGGITFSTNSTMTNIHVDPGTGDISFLPGTDDIGTMEFYIVVTDPEGVSDSVKVVLEVLNVNDPPTIPIIRSDTGVFVFLDDEVVKLTAIFTDPDVGVDPEEEISARWSSDIDGNLGLGEELITSDLSLGNHTVTVAITDSEGLSSSASVHVLIMELPEAPEPREVDPNETGGEVKTEKEGAPVVLIIFIVIIGLILLVGVVILVMMTMKKKDIPEENEEVPEETPEPAQPQET